MSTEPTAEGVASASPDAPVWDPLVRLFHWTLAFGCIANLTILREAGKVHRYVGYVVGAAIAVRLVWGVIGSPHARFSDFVPGPRRLVAYLEALLRRREPRYVGHNPAGAVMMLALLTLAAACGVTGWMMGLDAFWGERWLEELHEALADLILGLAALHVAAALVESWRHRENLIGAVVTGRKRRARGADVDHAGAPSQ